MRGSEREARPFGRRRPPEDPRLPEATGAPSGWGESARPAGPLLWALRTAALAGFAAVLATQYLVRVSGPGEVAPTQMAQARTPHADPETTGSIARGAAQATRLDPCAVADPVRARR